MSQNHELNIFKELMRDYDHRYDYSGINGERIAKRLGRKLTIQRRNHMKSLFFQMKKVPGLTAG